MLTLTDMVNRNIYLNSTGSLRNATDHLNVTTSSQTNNANELSPNNTAPCRFDSDGRFLLGQTSGSRILSAKSSQQVVAYIESTQSASRLAFGDSGTTNDLTVGIGSKANDLYFLAGSTEAARFDASGRLGIG